MTKEMERKGRLPVYTQKEHDKESGVCCVESSDFEVPERVECSEVIKIRLLWR